ncbi:2-isopropylmalate synthase [Halothiobacillus sp. DCM-1]|uniref:2-isopropylmalate synthase n=1 Tax=Halothiobacillus sp. DCM-1 TaxID=3112558 RepID=UPI003247EAD1
MSSSVFARCSQKYVPMPVIDLPDRQWPGRALSRAPIWLSTDLRDGNQSLMEPMSAARKLALFQLLCTLGFKEIEVGFPAASQVEFDFVRALIEQQHIPPEVTIQALTQARAPLIERTLVALTGARRAIVHLYIATSPQFRQTVFQMSRQSVLETALAAVRQVRAYAEAHPETEWLLEFSPETFNATEADFSLEICNAVTACWGISAARPVILNLPATVETHMPNRYADQIEWMHRRLAQREHVVLSVHPHNDRGTAVAAAELALLAGADRVEGCLFGQGERTGNVDLLTLALNCVTQGIDPGLDFSDLDTVIRSCTELTGIPVHPRHPYAGELVYTAFSGSHQDAIKKGFAAQIAGDPWQIPYLPIDPRDVGRSYAAVIRVNSQSGKGGIAYLLETAYGLALPRRLQIDFAQVVQRALDTAEREMDAATLWSLFKQTYCQTETPIALTDLRWQPEAAGMRVWLVRHQGSQHAPLQGQGNGHIAALIDALDEPMRLVSYEEHARGTGAEAEAVATISLRWDDDPTEWFGVGIDTDIVTASVQAVNAALNRYYTAR